MNDTTATTFIGIDVHARSAAACAINGLTGEIERASFGAGYTAAEIAEWALGFDSPAAVYEAGCTEFWLARGLRELGVPCAVGAPSKMQRPPADARKKNDRSDAEFLARLLSMRNVREVAVPDEECEAARDLCRARADAAADLTRARQRLNLFLMRRGHVYCERAAGGSPKASWSRGWWAWMRSLDLGGDSVAFDYYVSEVRHAEAQKRQLVREAQVEEAGRRAEVPEGHRGRHGDDARGRGGGVRPLRQRQGVLRVAGPGALGALQRRQGRARRHHQDRQLAVPQAARRVRVALLARRRGAQVAQGRRGPAADRGPRRQGRQARGYLSTRHSFSAASDFPS